MVKKIIFGLVFFLALFGLVYSATYTMYRDENYTILPYSQYNRTYFFPYDLIVNQSVNATNVSTSFLDVSYLYGYPIGFNITLEANLNGAWFNISGDNFYGDINASYVNNPYWINSSLEGNLSVNNSDYLDSLDSTQFLRSDQDDTLNGNLIINGNLTILEYLNNATITDIFGNGSMYPLYDNLFNLGNSTNRWANIYGTNLRGNLPWNNVTSYPSGCSKNYAITQLNDSITCSDDWLNADGSESAYLQNGQNYTFESGAKISSNSTCITLWSPSGTGVLDICDS